MKIYRKKLAAYLRTRRGKQTQQAFADRLGISQSTLNRIEQGEQNVTIDTLELLCKRLKCRIGDLVE